MEKHFPADLSVRVQDGIVTTSVQEPYFLPFPKDDKDSTDDPENLLVIDTRSDLTLSEIDAYDSFAVLTRDHLVLTKDKGDRRLYPLSSVKDFTVNKGLASGWWAKVQKFLGIALYPMLVALLVVTILSTAAWHLTASLVGALLVLLIGKLRKNPLSYGDAYKTAVFATGPVLIVSAVGFVIGVPVLPFHLDLLIFILVVFLNLRRAPSEPLPPAPIP